MAGSAPGELQRFIDDGDLEGLLSVVTLDEVAATWCRYTATPHAARDHEGIDDPDWWAVEFFFTEAYFANRELQRSVLLKLLEHATSELLIACIGAGPLEDFITDDEDNLRWIEHQAPRNERLRLALRNVWAADDVTEQTLLRLDAAAGQQLPRPRPREESDTDEHHRSSN
jgi:hypothetical protein